MLSKFQHLCSMFFPPINSLTSAQCWDENCVNDHALPLLMRLNPDQQILVLSLREERLLVMPNLSGEIWRQT